MAGKLINDHSFWAGKAGKDMVMPQGVHTKNESSAEGSGGLSHYEDTAETIKHQQEMEKKKIHSNPMKPGYKN